MEITSKQLLDTHELHQTYPGTWVSVKGLEVVSLFHHAIRHHLRKLNGQKTLLFHWGYIKKKNYVPFMSLN